MAQIRKPQQERSAQTWERMLSAGMEILMTEGVSSLTVDAICRAAEVSRTSFYARAGNISDFFMVLYERGMHEIIETRHVLFQKASALPVDSDDRIRAVADGLSETFEIHYAFLSPIIEFASSDQQIRDQGSRTSLPVLDEMIELLSWFGEDKAYEVARFLQQECIFRVMYGPQWLSKEPESRDDFVERLFQMSRARLRFN